MRKIILRILILHNKYIQHGGEDTVFELEKKMLNSKTNTVDTVVLDNKKILSSDNFKNLLLLVKLNNLNRIRATVDHFSTSAFNVAHVHNFFPLFTPNIHRVLAEKKIPRVQTLHNYRIICPGALLTRNGSPCELCVQGTFRYSVIHKCYRDSRILSLLVAQMNHTHRKENTWQTYINRFISLTQFAKDKFVDSGISKHLISVKPNFIFDPYRESKFHLENRAGAVYVGRLSEEKGIDTLLLGWKRITPILKIVGVGPFLLSRQTLQPNIFIMGQQMQPETYGIIASSCFLVLPSTCYEGFPMVILEAFAHGTPVLCSRLGSMAEIVEDGVTGLHFEAGNPDDLAEKAQWMFDHPIQVREMGENARQEYLKKYTPEVNYKMLMNIYREAIEDAKNR